FVDKLFYRNRYDHIKALQLFISETHNIMDTAILGTNMVTVIANALVPEAVFLLLPSAEKDGFVLKYSSDSNPSNNKFLLKNRSPFIGHLSRSDHIISIRDFDIIPQLQSIAPKEKKILKQIGAELFIPLKTGSNKLTGILILSKKRSEQSYSIEEKELVQTISNEMAIKLENARLYNNALQTRQNLETWLNSMADPVLIIGTNFTLQFINKPGMEKFGGQIGSVCWEVLGNTSKCPSCITLITSDIKRNTSQYMTKIGNNEYNVAVAPILNPDGSQSVIEVFRDITELKKAENEKKSMEAQLQQAQRMEALGTLAGGIAHDFNNLLMGILGYNALMLSDIDPLHPHHEHLTEIEGFVKSAVDLSKQLLGFARGGKYEVRAIDLNALIKGHNRIFGRTRKEITILGKYDHELWTVEADRGQIEQVLMNLFVNAWQAMSDRGEIFVHTENIVIDETYTKPFEVIPGNYVKISVTDSGIGMDKETVKKIFNPFFTTKEKERGTGMGLSSAYGIIKNHSGFITVYSEPGHGSTFNIYLPASTKKPEKEREESKEIRKGSGTILLIDDEKMILTVGKKLLQKLGYDVLTATNGFEGIKIYKKNQGNISIVILDMIMPNMTGSETFDDLKKIDPNAKVLLSSGYSLDVKALKILEQGCDGFIQKPFNMVQLSQKLHEILAN
ncbi:MAG: response regulator, partial [Deltaproteobacteria bacterium]|nr:response regulator [Deltaproteobacteria bacterium]